MKKLLFTLVGAAAFAALAADPSAGANDISLVGFENYTVDQTVVGYGDDGNSGGSLWSCAGDDASLVKAYGGDNATAPNITEPAPFDEAADPNTKYLALDTNGSELQRAIPAAGQTIGATGTYIDTLVQFTPSESAPTSSDLTGAKLAIWLGVVNNETNLYVQGAVYDSTDGETITAPTTQAYKLNKSCEPGQWYRLTVKAYGTIGNAAATEAGTILPAFSILIDGEEASTATSVYTQAALVCLCPSEGDGSADYNYLDADTLALFKAGKIIPSLDATFSPGTLTAVGFKGTGALDDFVVTTEAPSFTPAGIDFTLTWPSGVTPVSYKVGDGAAVAIDGSTTFPISVPDGALVAFTFTNADGATKTMTATASSSVNSIDASTAVYTWADYLGEAVDGAYTIDDANDLDMLRKGVDAGIATSGETFKQTANIDMTSAGAFAGIGTYAANLTEGVPFEGTYDGQNYKISNVTFTDRDYAGVFNQVKGGTIKNLTVDTITFPGVGSKCSAAIVGNAGLGATLQGLTATGSFGTQANPCKHNVAGIAIRLCGGANHVLNGTTMKETLVKDCTNNAALYGTYTKMGGICALTQDQNGVGDDYVLFDGCVNNGTLTMPSGDTAGRDGLGGIVAYTSEGTKLQNCVNTGAMSSTLATAKKGELVGWAQSRGLYDLGGNIAAADKPMIGSTAPSSGVYCPITGFEYATVANNVATTVLPPLTAGNTYLLEGNVAASETPVATLTAVGDTIAFDAALGYTFAGTVASSGAAGYPVASTSGTVTTYTAGYFPRTATAGQDGSAANPFELADADDLQAMKAAFAANDAYKAYNYKVVNNIDATDLGYWDGIGAQGTANTGLKGVLDGGGYTISNLKFSAGKYRGFFNRMDYATIKDLTINVVDIQQTDAEEHGYAAFVGNMDHSTLLNCTATGTIGTTAKPAMHTSAGFAVKVNAAGVFVNCTNHIDIVCSLTDNPKVGGIVGLMQGGALTNCWNDGDLTITVKTCGNDGNGVGGLVGYAQTGAYPISGGGNAGTIQSTATTVAASSQYDIHVGTIVGKTGSALTAVDGVVAQADAVPAGVRANVNGLNFATVDNNVATFVPDASLAAGNTYKVMLDGATATYAFAEAGTIAFDTALYTPTFAITAAEGLTLTDATSGTVKTYTAAAPSAGWVDDATTVTNQAAGTVYAALANTALATADAGELTTWAKAEGVQFADVTANPDTYVEAFLLNCAVAEVATEKEEFVLNITIGADGTPSVALPAGKDYNGKLQMKGSTDLNTWTDVESASKSYQFYKYILSL